MSSFSPSYRSTNRVPIETDISRQQNNEKNGTKKMRSRSPWFTILEGFIVGILLATIVLAVILTIWLNPKTNASTSTAASIKSTAAQTMTSSPTASTTTTTTTSVTTSSTSTTTTTRTTTSSTSTTTTVTCLVGYVQTPIGSCVNTQIDFNNCGSIGYVCPSNFTSCSAGICSVAPAVQLANGVGVPNWGGAYDVDDDSYPISLPFSISMYNYSTTNVTVTTNGIVCLGGCSTAYTNGNLPDVNFIGPTAFAYWDDLKISANTAQTVYYGIGGQAPNRTAIFEFYECHLSSSTLYYHFQVIFYENAPGIVQFIYFEITDAGASATVGVQKSDSGPAITYAVNQANSVTGNMTLTFNTNTGTYTG